MRRRTLIHNLQRILDANDLDDLFDGHPDGDAERLDLLRRLAGSSDSGIASTVAEVARRRGVTSTYIADRAAVLLSSIAERRRRDLYSVLGVAPLAGPEEIRKRWREVARRLHPDAGGQADSREFEQVKAAHAVLSDPQRRLEYEARWMATIGRTERAAAVLEASARPPAAAVERARAAGEVPRWTWWRRKAPTVGEVQLAGLPRLGALGARLDAALGEPGLVKALSLKRELAAALAEVDTADIDGAIDEVRRLIEGLHEVRRCLVSVRRLQERLQADPRYGAIPRIDTRQGGRV